MIPGIPIFQPAMVGGIEILTPMSKPMPIKQ